MKPRRNPAVQCMCHVRRGDHVLSREVSITEIPRARSVSQPIKYAKPQITNSDAKRTGGDTRHTPLLSGVSAQSSVKHPTRMANPSEAQKSHPPALVTLMFAFITHEQSNK